MRRHASTALVLASCLYGTIVRLWPSLAHDFPVETGGLFYVFIKDILAQHGGLPLQTTYNGGLPFAYPPLSFYVAAGLCQVTGAEPLEVLRFLPSVCAALTVPAVWLLARRLLSPLAAGWATVAFAIVPGDLLMIEGGGGLPRVMGLLLAILGLEATAALRSSVGFPKRTIVRAAALLAGAAACHPEIALFAVSSAALLFLVERSRGWFARGFGLAAVFGVLTGSWLIPDLLRHGLATYQGASTQPVPYAFIGGLGHWLLPYSLTGEFAVPAVQLAAMIGALVVVLKRDAVWLPLWVVGIVALDQRAPTLVLPVPVSLLAGYGIAGGLAPLLHRVGARWRVRPSFVAAPLLVPLGMSALYTFLVVSRTASSLSTDELDAMRWAARQTDPISNFLVVPGGDRLFVSEWFPALAQRRSVVTHEGTEWLGARAFSHAVHDFDAVQACDESNVTCLEGWQESTGRDFDYLLVSRDLRLAESLATAPDFELVYASDSQAIYRHQTLFAGDNKTPD